MTFHTRSELQQELADQQSILCSGLMKLKRTRYSLLKLYSLFYNFGIYNIFK